MRYIVGKAYKIKDRSNVVLAGILYQVSDFGFETPLFSFSTNYARDIISEYKNPSEKMIYRACMEAKTTEVTDLDWFCAHYTAFELEAMKMHSKDSADEFKRIHHLDSNGKLRALQVLDRHFEYFRENRDLFYMGVDSNTLLHYMEIMA